MISLLNGKLAHKAADGLAVDVNGVGYEVFVSMQTMDHLPALGEAVRLHIHTHVAEGIFALYGFLKETEKLLFKKLMSVSGIGPKLALAILSGLPASSLVQAIASKDIGSLTRISGVGKKTAERMCIELHDKLGDLADFHPSKPVGRIADEVLSALVNLGYNRIIAEKVLAGLDQQDLGFEEVLRKALGQLARG